MTTYGDVAKNPHVSAAVFINEGGEIYVGNDSKGVPVFKTFAQIDRAGMNVVCFRSGLKNDFIGAQIRARMGGAPLGKLSVIVTNTGHNTMFTNADEIRRFSTGGGPVVMGMTEHLRQAFALARYRHQYGPGWADTIISGRYMYNQHKTPGLKELKAQIGS